MGIQTNALFSGFPSTTLLAYDGSNWITSVSSSVSHSTGASGGTASSGLMSGGFDDPSILTSTEEFNPETTAANIKTLTTS